MSSTRGRVDHHFPFVLAAVAVVSVGLDAAAAGPTFTSSWKAPEASGIRGSSSTPR